ncbi:MAG: ATP-binding protein [Nitrososphaerota archaeon]|jgi:AAA+ ATPase superfamily predicted ATPase|nr:ATP-binding protein [Nitrososphaerota archaeon]
MLFDLNPKESPNELFGREEELDELVRLLRARRWVAVLGPRMVGKTSLVKVANTRIDQNAVYLNLWGVKGTQGLLSALVHGLNSSKSLLQKVRDGVERVEGLSVGPGGVSVAAPKKPLRTMWDLLNMIGKQKGNYVIELDEVQELAVISGHLLKMLANIFNTYSNMTFVFTGSIFGLMKTLIEPKSSSPLYGRSPAKLYLRPFEKTKAVGFLNKGFKEYGIKVPHDGITDAIEERLDGIPGWLALYGNNVAVRKMSFEKALSDTVSEGLKIVREELEHFLEGRDRSAYLAALKAAATSARWGELKGAMEARRQLPVNDATVYNVLESLKASMLIDEQEKVYRVNDPMLRTLLLTAKIR